MNLITQIYRPPSVGLYINRRLVVLFRRELIGYLKTDAWSDDDETLMGLGVLALLCYWAHYTREARSPASLPIFELMTSMSGFSDGLSGAINGTIIITASLFLDTLDKSNYI